MHGVVVSVVYRPKLGKANETAELVRSRVPTLRNEGLATDRTPTIMRARDGTIIEVSEWKSQEAIDARAQEPKCPCDLEQVFRGLRLRPAQHPSPNPLRCLPDSNRSLIE
jgi:quinol monooxygenase YgiN